MRVFMSTAALLNYSRIQPKDLADPELRRLAAEAGKAQDAAYDALQAFADALYAEALDVKGQSVAQADLLVRGVLAQVGEEMAHDWQYGATAP